MSILNDLDPANARIPFAARKSSNRFFAWASALVPLFAGMLWVYLGNGVASNDQANISPVAQANDVSAAPVQLPPPVAALTPTTNEGSAALIRTAPTAASESVDKSKQPNAFAALQIESAAGSGVPPPSATATSQSTKPKASQRTEQKQGSGTKNAKRPAQKDTADSQRLARSSKRPAERDIAIISAIVR